MSKDTDRHIHFFVCINERPDDAALPSCARRGSQALLQAFLEELERRGFPRGVKVSGSTCLTTCQCGPTVVVYPKGAWYVGVSELDIEELFNAHLAGVDVDRLSPPEDVTVW